MPRPGNLSIAGPGFRYNIAPEGLNGALEDPEAKPHHFEET